MNKFLPKTANNTQGFTLVELLIAISILAVLSVIGFNVYTSAQGSARDAKRREDIKAIALAIESTKNPSTGDYIFNAASSLKDFPNSLPTTTTVGGPVDPLATPSNGYSGYCIITASSGTPPANITTSWTVGTTSTCPSAGEDVRLSISQTSGTDLGSTSATTAPKAWTLCAALERVSTPFCINSQSR